VNGQVQINFGPEGVTNTGNLTTKQAYALETLHSLCRSHSFQLTQRAGDILFANNVSILHARDAYVDVKVGPKRRMLALMLHDTKTSWKLSKQMDYHLRDMFEYAPTEQLLFTASEWTAAPRDFRYRISKYAQKHG